jgi:hypothetical protein
MEVRAIAVQVGDLLGLDTAFSADGRADINSKRASHQGCDAEFRQTLQFRIHQLAPHLRLLHLEISPKDFGMVSGNLNRHDDVAEPAPC